MILPDKATKTFYSGKQKIEYTTTGVGQPVILLHGLFGNLSNWSSTVAYFSRSHQVIVPALPVYDATWSKDVLKELTAYVHTLITELNLSDVILVGNSLGGHVAILYALAHPGKVNRLVLTGSAGLFENGLGVSYPKRGDYKYISDKVKYTFYNEEVVSDALIDDVYKTVNDARKSLGILRIAKATNRSSVAGDLPKLKMPVLLIWGRQDRITPIDVAFQFLDLLPGNTALHVIENCGHAPMMEQPEEFNRILNDYLRKAALGSRYVSQEPEGEKVYN